MKESERLLKLIQEGAIDEVLTEGVIQKLKDGLKKSKDAKAFTMKLNDAITSFEKYVKESGVIVAPLSNDGFTDDINKQIDDMRKSALRENFKVVEKTIGDTKVLFAGETENTISMVAFCIRTGFGNKMSADGITATFVPISIYKIANFEDIPEKKRFN